MDSASKLCALNCFSLEQHKTLGSFHSLVFQVKQEVSRKMVVKQQPKHKMSRVHIQAQKKHRPRLSRPERILANDETTKRQTANDA